jgi:hypothetical protein
MRSETISVYVVIDKYGINEETIDFSHPSFFCRESQHIS